MSDLFLLRLVGMCTFCSVNLFFFFFEDFTNKRLSYIVGINALTQEIIETSFKSLALFILPVFVLKNKILNISVWASVPEDNV